MGRHLYYALFQQSCATMHLNKAHLHEPIVQEARGTECIAERYGFRLSANLPKHAFKTFLLLPLGMICATVFRPPNNGLMREEVCSS